MKQAGRGYPDSAKTGSSLTLIFQQPNKLILENVDGARQLAKDGHLLLAPSIPGCSGT